MKTVARLCRNVVCVYYKSTGITTYPVEETPEEQPKQNCKAVENKHKNTTRSDNKKKKERETPRSQKGRGVSSGWRRG